MSVVDIGWLGTSLTNSYLSYNWQGKVVSNLSVGKRSVFQSYNFGQPGATVADGLANVAGLINLRPRFAVVEFGMNDAVSYLNIPVSSFAASLRQIVLRLRQGSPATRVMLMTMNPVIGSALATIPDLPSYYQALRGIAAEQATGLIDNTPLWAGATTAQIPDGVHPSEAAITSILVPNVTAVLRPYVL